jgi:hypothetical protein
VNLISQCYQNLAADIANIRCLIDDAGLVLFDEDTDMLAGIAIQYIVLIVNNI